MHLEKDRITMAGCLSARPVLSLYLVLFVGVCGLFPVIGANVDDVDQKLHVQQETHDHPHDTHTEFYDQIMEHFESFEVLLPTLASYLLMGVVMLRVGYWLATYREFLLTVVAAWALWWVECSTIDHLDLWS